MTIEIEISKLSELLTVAAANGAKRALEETGTITGIITLADIKRQYKSRLAKEARMSQKILWMPMGKAGHTSGVYCKREQFDRFLFERKFSFNS